MSEFCSKFPYCFSDFHKKSHRPRMPPLRRNFPYLFATSPTPPKEDHKKPDHHHDEEPDHHHPKKTSPRPDSPQSRPYTPKWGPYRPPSRPYRSTSRPHRTTSNTYRTTFMPDIPPIMTFGLSTSEQPTRRLTSGEQRFFLRTKSPMTFGRITSERPMMVLGKYSLKKNQKS
jgi:hypothetical protein